MSHANYFCLKNALETEYEIKKSRFITRLAKAEDREQAMAQLQQAQKDYPDARHHCWAYLIGHPVSPRLVAMSDDGEPNGTAGKPILNVLQHKAVGDVMVVVIRYFGGIKLGAGGLVRAYSQATQLAFDQAEFEERVFKETITVHCPFHAEQNIRHWLGQHQGAITLCEYSNEVTLTAELADEHIPALESHCLGIDQCRLQPSQEAQ